jgi:hypothetical protein
MTGSEQGIANIHIYIICMPRRFSADALLDYALTYSVDLNNSRSFVNGLIASGSRHWRLPLPHNVRFGRVWHVNWRA